MEETTMVTIWEGRRTKRLRRGSNVGGYRRSRPAFGRRGKVTFAGEELASWCDGLPFAHQRGTEFRVFRTASGEIVVHRVRWSTRTTADDEGKVFRFKDLDAAAARFRSVLEKAGVLH